VRKIRALGGTGATSNPIIIGDLIKTGRFDDLLTGFIDKGMKDEEIAWALTDQLVNDAQAAFLPAWEQARGDDGYVSCELDPLLEDVKNRKPRDVAKQKYIELAKNSSAGHETRMI